MAEIAGEIENLAGHRPSTADEFCRAVDYLVARIPCSYETCAQMADALAYLIVYQLPIDYLRNQSIRLRGLRPNDVTETCCEILAAGGPKWLVVGKATALIDRLYLAGFGNIEVRDSDNADVF
jgi:hypothetical protein